MRLLVCIILYFTMVVNVSAAQYVGIAFDTSSNMLMRPESVSGTFAALYGSVSKSVKDVSLAYGFDSGVLEHYEGLQYHRHTVDASLPVMQSEKGYLAFALESTIARYGDVTILDGYEQFGLASTAKYYFTSKTLFRWEGALSKRTYPDFETENYNEIESFFRLDRFFDSGMTVRGQIDIGYRSYYEFSNAPSSLITGLKCRIAKSIGPQWGIWAEGFVSNTSSVHADADSTELFNRIFLDDPYKYSKTGMVVNIKHRFVSGNSLELRSALQKRHYDKSLGNDYLYLPDTGWDETEYFFNLHIIYQPRWIPSLVIPSIDMYYRDVSASDNVLSYTAYGMTLSFDLF